MNNNIKTIKLNCGEGRTQISLSIIPVAWGAVGDGIFIFDGEGGLKKRNLKKEINIINKRATGKLLRGETPKSFAIPVDKEFHLPIKVYVGILALKELCKEINQGKYEYFRYLGIFG